MFFLRYQERRPLELDEDAEDQVELLVPLARDTVQRLEAGGGRGPRQRTKEGPTRIPELGETPMDTFCSQLRRW